MTPSQTDASFTSSQRMDFTPVMSGAPRARDAEIGHVAQLIRSGINAAWGEGSAVRGRTLVMLCGADEALETGLARYVRDTFGMLVIRVEESDLVSPSLAHTLARADVVFANGPEGEVGTLSALRLNHLSEHAVIVWHCAVDAIDTEALTHALWFDTIGAVAGSPDMLSADALHALRLCDKAILSARKPCAVRASATVHSQESDAALPSPVAVAA
ncbi:MAG: hypothetical protein AAFZ01_10215 [Pseudomonadota bacterium]